VTKVEISQGLLAGLVAVAVAASLVLAFLLGRGSAPGPPREAPRAADGPSIPAVPHADPAPAVPAAPISPAGPSSQPAAPGPAVSPTAGPVPGNSSVRTAVAAYFQAIEAIQPEASGNPEALALQATVGLGHGDTSGIDDLIRQTQTARNRLAALTPPQPCAAYHRELLGSLDDGLGLMQSIKQLISSANPSAQAAELMDRANAMKARSETLKRMEKDLKQHYGGGQGIQLP